MPQIPEPPFHDDDTDQSNESLVWKQRIDWLSLLGATVFTLATIVILFLPQGENNSPLIVNLPTESGTASSAIPADIDIVVTETALIPQAV